VGGHGLASLLESGQKERERKRVRKKPEGTRRDQKKKKPHLLARQGATIAMEHHPPQPTARAPGGRHVQGTVNELGGWLPAELQKEILSFLPLSVMFVLLRVRARGLWDLRSRPELWPQSVLLSHAPSQHTQLLLQALGIKVHSLIVSDVAEWERAGTLLPSLDVRELALLSVERAGGPWAAGARKPLCYLQDLPPGGLGGARLHRLYLGRAPQLRSLHGLRQLAPSLAELQLEHCSSLQDISELALLPDLRCAKFAYIRPAFGLASLQRSATRLRALSLSHCPFLTQAEALARLPCLEELELASCSNLRDLGFLAGHPSLRRLSLRDLWIPDLSSWLPTLPRLEYLQIDSCHALATLNTGGRTLPGLRVLVVLDCSSLQTLQLPHCAPRLEFLHVRLVPQLGKALLGSAPWPRLPALRRVDLGDLEPPGRSLDFLAASPHLHTLRLRYPAAGCTFRGCPFTHTPDLGPLAACRKLRVLSLAPALGSIEPSGLGLRPELRELELRGLVYAPLPALLCLPNLCVLRLQTTQVTLSLGALATLAKLETLDLSGSVGLAVVRGLASLRRLRRVYVTGCASLCFIENLDLLRARGVGFTGLPDTYPFRRGPPPHRGGVGAKRRLTLD